MRTPNQHCIINYMGRKPKKEHVHGYARVSHVALHLKQTHTLLQHCESALHQHKTQITRRECWLYSFGALVTWAAATSLKPWVPWMDCLGAEGGREVGRMHQPMNPAPWTWWACSPLHQPTTSRSWRVLLQWNHTYCAQRTWHLWAGGASESPLGSTSPGDGVPASSFLP